ncbi:hypothetical protein MalM25_19510 [Planctomycetes bacterium MalM25]|nr:hypothetical protein MalM25_19510 [Planctomycetes bacterium MalM25]
MRHRPTEPELRQALPWMATENHDLFNAYQSFHGRQVERALDKLAGAGQIASFLGVNPGEAVFVGLYDIAAGTRSLTLREYGKQPGSAELMSMGMRVDLQERDRMLHFDLRRRKEYADWLGRLIVTWPPPERAWWRRAERNTMPIKALLQENSFAPSQLDWREVDFSWEQLGHIPSTWRYSLQQWRGVYHILDASDGKRYVGSAYGADNIYGRWNSYASSGHGGNKLLRNRDPKNFRFSIL